VEFLVEEKNDDKEDEDIPVRKTHIRHFLVIFLFDPGRNLY